MAILVVDASMAGSSLGVGGQRSYNAWGQSHSPTQNANKTSVAKHCNRQYANLGTELNC